MSNLKAKYQDNSESRFHISQIEWAKGMLAKDEIIWPNGKSSHVEAGRIWEESEDALIEHIVLVAFA